MYFILYKSNGGSNSLIGKRVFCKIKNKHIDPHSNHNTKGKIKTLKTGKLS